MTPIYHITHYKNLSSIINHDGLFCDNASEKDEIKPVCIGHRDLKERRARHMVSISPGGFLADYVPFYFAPRSPMLYVNYKRSVSGYTEGQKPIVHLVSSAESVDNDGKLNYIFTDGHPVKRFTKFSCNLKDLDKVDWDLMKRRYWYDIDSDPDRMRRRNAEFLVQLFFPWRLITEIGVSNQEIANIVQSIVSRAVHKPQITVHCDWYY